MLGQRGGLRDVRALLELPNDPLARLKSALSSARAELGVPLDKVRLRAPILHCSTVTRLQWCTNQGHASGGGTAAELSNAWYRLPIFSIPLTPLRIFGPQDAIPSHPSPLLRTSLRLRAGVGGGSSAGKVTNVAEADAFSYIAGFTIFNDWSCRDLQRDEMEARLGPAKGKDSASSLGPWIVTTDELGPFISDGRLRVRCTLKVNGVRVDGEQRWHHVSQLGGNDRARLAGQPNGSWRRTWRGYGHRRIGWRGHAQWIPSALSRTRGRGGDRGRKGSAFCATLSRQR